MSAVLQRMDVDAFLAWTESQDERYELVDGDVVAMAPEVGRHIRTKGLAFVALRAAIQAAGLPCEAYVDGFGVKIDDRSLFIPDALVQCGAQPADNVRLADAPVIVVEVLSPSTSRRDTDIKLPGYFRLPSLHHYLILDPEKRIVVHHRRAGAGVEMRTCSDGTLALDLPGIALAVADLFPT